MGRPNTVVGHYAFQVALPCPNLCFLLNPKIIFDPFFLSMHSCVVVRWGEAFLVDADPALTLPSKANPVLTPICPHVSPNVSCRVRMSVYNLLHCTPFLEKGHRDICPFLGVGPMLPLGPSSRST